MTVITDAMVTNDTPDRPTIRFSTLAQRQFDATGTALVQHNALGEVQLTATATGSIQETVRITGGWRRVP